MPRTARTVAIETADIAILTPTAPEWLGMLEHIADPRAIDDFPLPTKIGTIGPHSVLCCNAGKGQEEMGTAATLILERAKPSALLVVGIAGGFPSQKVFRGDVIVAHVIHSFDYGKLVAGTFKRRPETDINCDRKLLSWAEIAALKPDAWRRLVSRQRPDGKPSSSFSVHVDCYVASSNKVMDDPDQAFYASVASAFPEIHGVEMEGIGAGAGARLAQAERAVGFMMIRGISDEPGSGGGRDERTLWKAYAVATAAAFTRALIEELPAKDQNQLLLDRAHSSSSDGSDGAFRGVSAEPVTIAASSKMLLRAQVERSLPGLNRRLRREAPERLRQVLHTLNSLCIKAESLSVAADEALSARDDARYRHLRLEQAKTSTRIQDGIIAYIRLYLDTRPVGERARFSIRFTDSRALFGAERLSEWLDDIPYLNQLFQLTRTAGSTFDEGLISRAFVIESFSDLASDAALMAILIVILERHLQSGIPVALVSLRRIEDWGLSAVNFCAFENGLVMSLDLGPTAELQLFDERDGRDELRNVHESLGKSAPGVVYMRSSPDLLTFQVPDQKANPGTLAFQVGAEADGRAVVHSAGAIGNSGNDYDERVATWWGDEAWDEERRSSETAFLAGWLERFIGEDDHPEVLDAACGTGTHAFIAAELGFKVTACDASWHQIKRARLIARRREGLPPSNPFFRTLRWTELRQRYAARFRGVLCLGGSMIHASADELPLIAQNFCRVVKPPGVILIDHRESRFFNSEANRRATHAGHSREVEFDEESRRLVFHMRNNVGERSIISGTLHSIDALVQAFASAGADLAADFHDHDLDERAHVDSARIPEWHHLTFRVG